MGDRVARPEGGAAESPQSPSISYSYQETNLNIGPQLRFPPIEQIQEIEANCPGFTERMVALIQREAAHRQGLEQQQLDKGHEYRMKELHLDDRRIGGFLLAAILVFVGFAVTGIYMVAKGRVAEAAICAGVCALPSLATVINSVRGRPAKS